MAGAQGSKPIKIGTSSGGAVEFEDFEGVTVIDTGGSGLTIEDEDGNSGEVPTGIPFTLGGPGSKLSSYLKVTGTFTYALYQ